MISSLTLQFQLEPFLGTRQLAGPWQKARFIMRSLYRQRDGPRAKLMESNLPDR